MAYGRLENVKYAIKEGKLLLEIDLDPAVPGRMTKSGNTTVATSNDWVQIDEMPGWNFNMILTRKPNAPIPADSPDETMVERPKTMKA